MLTALVVADCLTESSRWPGVLLGLADAVKLTPVVFVLFFLLRRDYKAARTAALSALAITAAWYLPTWHDSVQYWSSVPQIQTAPIAERADCPTWFRPQRRYLLGARLVVSFFLPPQGRGEPVTDRARRSPH